MIIERTRLASPCRGEEIPVVRQDTQNRTKLFKILRHRHINDRVNFACVHKTDASGEDCMAKELCVRVPLQFAAWKALKLEIVTTTSLEKYAHLYRHMRY